eukprot:m.171481 g.171481  ORF g.171481 m.171481 type:complete len:394 (+) comp25182_c0_seq2:1864-3045(+)
MIENEYFSILFADVDLTITNKHDGTRNVIQATLDFYLSNIPDSNAYIFKPLLEVPEPVSFLPVLSVTRGPTYQQAVIQFDSTMSLRFRLYAGINRIEMLASVHPIHISNIYKEFVVYFDTDLDNLGETPTFFTDANGMDTKHRISGRTGWGINNVTEPVAGNYYPASSAASIRDRHSNKSFTLLFDRAHGVASRIEGDLEVMVHRRCALLEHISLNDTSKVDALFFLHIGNPLSTALFHRIQQAQMSNPLRAFFMHPDERVIPSSFSAMPTALPPNVHLLSFNVLPAHTGSPNSTNSVTAILRLHHIFDISDPIHGTDVQVNVESLFVSSLFRLVKVQETQASATMPLADVHRMQWKTDQSEQDTWRAAVGNSTLVTLSPMQIRTFLLTFERK